MSQDNEKSLQDVMSGDLFVSSKGEMVETLKFMEGHAVPLTQYQVAAMAYCEYLDKKNKSNIMGIFSKAIKQHTKDMAKPSIFIDVIEALTLADRIKGNVRLNNIFRGNNEK